MPEWKLRIRFGPQWPAPMTAMVIMGGDLPGFWPFVQGPWFSSCKSTGGVRFARRPAVHVEAPRLAHPGLVLPRRTGDGPPSDAQRRAGLDSVRPGRHAV